MDTMLGIVTGLGLLSTILFLLIIFSGKWFFFGLKDFFAKSKLKSHHGYLFLMDKANNMGLPKIIDLRKDKYSETLDGLKDGATYPYSSDDLMKGTFLGRPYLIKGYDDAKTSIGMYYQESDKDGKPLFWLSPEGKTVPKLSELKPSVSLSPGFFTALVGDHALTQALKDLMQKNSTLLYLLLGIGAGIIAIGFLLYNINTETLPQILQAAKDAAIACTEKVVVAK
jgi:hypothetical protein